VHDSVHFELQGIPAAAVATTEFLRAARAQASALGLPAFEVVPVPHPVQIKTAEEMRQLADEAFPRIVAALTGQAA
jgi:hypothetical protein